MLRRLRFRNLAAKLSFAFAAIAVLCVALQGWLAVRAVRPEVSTMGRENLAAITDGVLAMCQAQQDLLSQVLAFDLRLAEDTMAQYGSIVEGPKVSVSVADQTTKASTTVTIPTWKAGRQPIHDDWTIVDHVQRLAPEGTTCTIFQRTEPGLLRVSTNVKKDDGSRAVGTYIPASSPVAQAVLQGATYQGIANVMGKPYVALYKPLKGKADEVIGALYVGVPQESVASLREGILKTKVGDTGYVYVLDSKGTYVISNKGERDGENILETPDASGHMFVKDIVNPESEARKTGWIQYPWKNKDDKVARMKIARLAYFEPWDWVIGAGSYIDEFEKPVYTVTRSILISSAIALAIAAAVGLWVAFGVAKPIRRVADRLEAISGGGADLTQELEVLTADETGRLATAFNRFVGGLAQMIRDIRDATDQVSTGCQTTASSAEGAASGVQEIASTAGSVAEGAAQQRASLTEATGLVGEQDRALASLTQSADTLIQQVREATLSLQQMSQAVQSAADQAQSVAQAAERAQEAAQRGGGMVRSSLQGMERTGASADESMQRIEHLAEKSRAIGDIVDVIDDVSEQTNLLALNAAIEAARAGEHGKGFAVVADEVRKLAERATQSADEIRALIREVQNGVAEAVECQRAGTREVAEGLELASRAGEAIDEIVGSVGDAAEAVQQISAATEQLLAQCEETRALASEMEAVSEQNQEMLAMVADVASRVRSSTEGACGLAESAAAAAEESSAATEELAAGVEEMTAVTQEVSSAAERVKEMLARFHV